MLQNHVSALPVVNGRGSCVGVISATDILSLTQELEDELLALSKAKDYMRQRVAERLANSEMATERVQEVMTREVVRIEPGATLAAAAATMVRHHVHRVMVIDDEQRLVGIVSTMDVMRSLATNKS
jgi:CBS domain-containing protein